MNTQTDTQAQSKLLRRLELTESHEVDFHSLTNRERDVIVAGILKKNPDYKPAAVKQILEKDDWITTYDDVFYSVQRVKLNIKWEQYKKTTNQK